MPQNRPSPPAQPKPSEDEETLWDNSSAAKALKELQANPRVKYIVIAAPADACPVCQQLTGTYHKDQTPRLPISECSHPLGCRAFYMPYLDEIYP